MEFPDYFDIIIVAIIIILALKGLFNGFIREICSTIGIVGGVLVASRYNIEFGGLLNSVIKLQSNTLLNLIGFMIILAAIWILALVLAEIIVKFAKFINLGRADKFLGVFVAGIKIFLVLSIILFTFSKINFLSSFTAKLQDSSVCYPIMINIGSFIVKTDFVSEIKEQAVQNINEGLQEVQRNIAN